MKDSDMEAQNGEGGKKLLEQVRDLLRKRHYSLTTEKSYVYWIRQFIFFFQKQHPALLPTTAISEFLTYLARSRRVAPSTQNQALCGLIFLYQEVLKIEVGELPGIEWAEPRERIPVVLSRDEVENILMKLQGQQKLIAALLYGAGLRLAECLRLRRKDLDFKRNQISVWDSKSMKDRVVMLPSPLREPLLAQLKSVRPLWDSDRKARVPGVELPYALGKKYPRAGEQWKWFWVFPSHKLSTDPRTNVMRRHHLYDDILQEPLADAVKFLGIEKHITAKTFRHSFATHLIDDGTDIRTVQTLLGHKDLRTTMIYTHVLLRGPAGVRSPLEKVYFDCQQTSAPTLQKSSEAPHGTAQDSGHQFVHQNLTNGVIRSSFHQAYKFIKGLLWQREIPKDDGSLK